MPRFIDRTGMRFGRLTVVEFSHMQERKDRRGSYSIWLCQCDCGNSVTARSDNLKSGNTLSCDCMRSQIHTKHGHAQTTELRPTPEYETWQHMHKRCSNPNDISFERYGERGITVCERWNDFENFLADMRPRPKGRYSIERINNEGNYEPDNCIWATAKEQANNRRPRRWWKRPIC